LDSAERGEAQLACSWFVWASQFPSAACEQGEREEGMEEKVHLFLFWFILGEKVNPVQCS